MSCTVTRAVRRTGGHCEARCVHDVDVEAHHRGGSGARARTGCRRTDD
jgi:hypothetical protein